MKKILILLAVIITASLFEVQAQGFGIWTNASLEKKWLHSLSTDVSVGYRAGKNLKYSDRWDASVGLKYDICDFLKIGTSYVYMHSYTPEEKEKNYKDDIVDNLHWRGYNKTMSYWRNKHRWTADLTGKAKAGRFSFSLRERYQLTHFNEAKVVKEQYRFPNPAIKEDAEYKGEKNDVKRAKNTHFLRSKLAIDYDIKKCPIKPFISYEFHNNLSQKLHLEKSRLAVGFDWKITKMHRMSFAYIFEDQADEDNEGNMHVLDIGYKIKF